MKRAVRRAMSGPLVPPDPATSGIPADPTQALEALAVHGTVPDCHTSEQIEDLSDDEGGAEDHVHLQVPVSPFPRLEGHAEAILPYLAHPSEPVVYRAATLLCFIQDAQSDRALEWLRTRYPCHGWVSTILAGAGMGRSPMTCPDDDSKVGSDLLSTPPTDGSKPSPEALALAERISKGEVPAVHQALLATLAMELARRPDGVQALRNVSTPRGLALVFQALLERWDVKLLLSRPSWLRPQAYWDANQFLKEVGWAALRTVAERTGRSRESVLVEAVGLVPSDPVMTLHSVVSEDRPLYYAIGRFARSPAGGEVTPATAREFLDRINRETAGNDPQEIEAESKRITALYHAKDVMALKQIASPLYPPNDFHALLAACYLVGLGEEEFALPLLEKRTPLGLLHDLNAIRSEVKQLLDRAEPGARKERLQRLYEKLSKHCKLNDCTTESPR